MQKYLYLTQTSWVNPWVCGGEVPLNLASHYKRVERSGIYTPDEVRIDRSSMDLDKLAPAFVFGESNRNCYIGEVAVDGVVLGRDIHIDRYEEDGLILCLCNRKSKRVAERLEKAACVRILNVELLASIISKQLGVNATFGECSYTSGHERHHFLKSDADSWQDEYRLFWSHETPVKVRLPPGIATRIKL